MSTLEVGRTVEWGLYVTNANGQAENVGTMPSTQAVTLPDGTAAVANVTTTSAGTYKASYGPSVQAGRHRIRWTGSGANSGGLPYTDHADVWPADPRMIIPLADARDAVNSLPLQRAKDDELRLYIAATTVVIEDITGPVLSATKVESRSGAHRSGLALWDYPESITTVKEDGVTLAATDYSVDEAGILWRGQIPGNGKWSGQGMRNVEITYKIGGAIIQPNIILAAREELRFLYQIGQQGGRPLLGGPPTPQTYTPSGYAVPNRVVELLGSAPRLQRTPGFA